MQLERAFTEQRNIRNQEMYKSQELYNNLVAISKKVLGNDIFRIPDEARYALEELVYQALLKLQDRIRKTQAQHEQLCSAALREYEETIEEIALRIKPQKEVPDEAKS